jgi:streptomycin 6-kinase
MFGKYLNRWQLIPDGDPIRTSSGRLLPVRWKNTPAILKVATEAEERVGGLLMAWWDGQGAAKVFAQEGEAILLERAECNTSLAELARSGRDDEATRIICTTVALLHTPRAKPPPELITLSRWFQELGPAAAVHGGLLSLSAETANALLADPQDVRVLHGDIHHDNVLDFGERGWLAIDPKGLSGERGFDYANLFCNPDLADPSHPVATTPIRFERRLTIVSEAAGLDRRRLAKWVLAWSGLSAAWFISGGTMPGTAVRVAGLFRMAELAAVELSR